MWFTAAAARLSGEPLLQAILAALATFILEDPTTIGCGLLVADEKMAFVTAFIGVSLGIAIGRQNSVATPSAGARAGWRSCRLGVSWNRASGTSQRSQ